MPYQVRAGSFTVVVASPQQAMDLFDRFVGDGVDEVDMYDMDGIRLDPAAIRALLRED